MSETQFWCQRLAKTTIRALHILGVAVSSAGFMFAVDKALWINWWVLAMMSGVTMMSLEIYRSKLWLIQLKGILTFVKLFMLLSIIWLPAHQANIYITVILLSVFIAHGPAGLRHYSIWHRKRIDEKKQLNG
ncbi:membrane protein [Photobacterium angustum]|nr:membrane protein [Photobacterium angustum]